MTVTTPPTAPGGFSHDPDGVAAAPSSNPTHATNQVRTAPFLAPPSPEEQTPAPLARDFGEVTMDRLRHPFTAAPDTGHSGD